MFTIRVWRAEENVRARNEKDKIHKERCGGWNITRKNQKRREKKERAWEGRGWLEEESLVRLITSGSKFPLNHFDNTQAILLKDEAIRLRPTFHLGLTFMSSAQFYNSECNVYLLADAILPCYRLNRTGLIIISPRANMLPTKTPYPDLFPRKYLAKSFPFIPAITPKRTCALYNKLFHFHMNCRSTWHLTGHWWGPGRQQSNPPSVPTLQKPFQAPLSEGEDL